MKDFDLKDVTKHTLVSSICYTNELGLLVLSHNAKRAKYWYSSLIISLIMNTNFRYCTHERSDW